MRSLHFLGVVLILVLLGILCAAYLFGWLPKVTKNVSTNTPLKVVQCETLGQTINIEAIQKSTACYNDNISSYSSFTQRMVTDLGNSKTDDIVTLSCQSPDDCTFRWNVVKNTDKPELEGKSLVYKLLPKYVDNVNEVPEFAIAFFEEAMTCRALENPERTTGTMIEVINGYKTNNLAPNCVQFHKRFHLNNQ